MSMVLLSLASESPETSVETTIVLLLVGVLFHLTVTIGIAIPFTTTCVFSLIATSMQSTNRRVVFFAISASLPRLVYGPSGSVITTILPLPLSAITPICN